MHGKYDKPLTAADLAGRPDFALGDASIRPSIRVIRGPGGEVTVEPRVMQVLLVLRDAGGAVVTRDALERRCWGGVFVSDDSINRAIAAVRRAARRVAGGSFEIETIPRTGYRLLVSSGAPASIDPARSDDAVGAPRVSRRHVMIGAASAAMAASGFLVWRQARPDPAEARVDALVEQGRDAWRLGLPDAEAQGIGFLREATAAAPARADAWGLLALLHRNVVEYGGPDQTMAAVTQCQQAARRALALEPKQGDALAALAALPPIFGDWLGARGRFLAAREAAPDNAAAAANLAHLEMSVGRAAASLELVESMLGRDPLAAAHQHKQIYLLWTAGRLAEMDRAADRAIELWPRHPAIWFARMWTLGFTGRPAAARMLVNDAGARPDMPPSYVDLLDSTFAATETRDPAAVEKAVAANLALAPKSPGAAVSAIQHLSLLGAVEPALDVAEGFLARRGPEVGQLRHTDAHVSLNDQHHRKTMMLWVPVAAPLRANPRFASLVEEIGLGDSWRKSGLGPDYLRGGTTSI